MEENRTTNERSETPITTNETPVTYEEDAEKDAVTANTTLNSMQ